MTYWYVVRVHHRHESRAEMNLNAGHIETFLPWVRVPDRRRRPEKREPLFPQYLFARFDAEQSLHDVTFTRGVQRVVNVGDAFATVDDEVIDVFRSRIDEHGAIPLGRPLEAGDRVRIDHGPFADLAGVVERILPAHERVLLLLTTVGTKMRVEVPLGDVRAQGAASSW